MRCSYSSCCGERLPGPTLSDRADFTGQYGFGMRIDISDLKCKAVGSAGPMG